MNNFTKITIQIITFPFIFIAFSIFFIIYLLPDKIKNAVMDAWGL